ncbi:death-associated inhibitor of apoptosis 2-like [Bombus pyrosoma]|uniref:death-associated inhibitor of apoptosis 2-like n=1 Tax=Bombus pyrosoma TaxID=396416 RepID=UPI001CB97280|nr:death-associated inhibitor of apoptosis 2-like [Bombus pyrosoma]
MDLVKKIAALEKENQALKDARLCKVCVEEQASVTFLPCGHLATCHNCSQAFTKCIICRSEIRDVTRTFLA